MSYPLKNLKKTQLYIFAWIKFHKYFKIKPTKKLKLSITYTETPRKKQQKTNQTKKKKKKKKKRS